MSSSASGITERRPRAFRVVEIAAALFTVLCVWLTAKEHILCWPTGILGALLYLWVFYYSRLYSDMLLQLYFLVTSIWGWYNWQHGGENATVLRITRLPLWGAGACLAIVAAGTAALGAFMKHRTRAALPYVDAATTVVSLVAQYLLGAKILETWVLWIAADVVDSGVYLKRKLYATALLYAVLLALAVMGLVEWIGRL